MSIPTSNETLEILESKSFHHNNLILQLEFDKIMEIWHINVHHVNFNDNYSMFGMFLDYKSAKAKFDSIKL